MVRGPASMPPNQTIAAIKIDGKKQGFVNKNPKKVMDITTARQRPEQVRYHDLFQRTPQPETLKGIQPQDNGSKTPLLTMRRTKQWENWKSF
jgi:hypothetical protein